MSVYENLVGILGCSEAREPKAGEFVAGFVSPLPVLNEVDQLPAWPAGVVTTPPPPFTERAKGIPGLYNILYSTRPASVVLGIMRSRSSDTDSSLSDKNGLRNSSG